ncbi:hypothetical protein [Cesiribacter andamanensis]|uniref:Uncharacterized protein n=1 Tax=Cesiribacter andamanensis AMV16 TaxID=1279009 RepID=M7NBD2_9BACT|nr:hypothetical protein [Cesiribacter andamanensis]EMR04511.1 hypothetical protein ADICEAN_00269 [Cesiribacter andamanensis AMV16]
MRNIAAFLPLFLLLGSGLCQAQSKSSAQQAFSLAEEAHKATPANYRSPLDALRRLKPDPSDQLGENMFYQAMMTYQSFAGNYDSALYYADMRYQRHLAGMTLKEPNTAFLSGMSIRVAKDVLLREIREHQVVMMNEAHHLPSHRAFVLNLLDDLQKQGFHHLAMETLSADQLSPMLERGYPLYESGFYQREPLFGELMRQALKKGFKLVAYESETPCPPSQGKDRSFCNRFRDSIQAVNLARWVQNNPDEKLFVYAGYSHIYESTKDEWIHMAQFFQQMTGIDPLTIDQTLMNEHQEPRLEDPRYAALTAARSIQVPVVLQQQGSSWSHSDEVDITVFHPRYSKRSSIIPRYQDKSNRPGFYLLHNQRRPILLSRQPGQTPFPSELIPANTHMILAYYKGEEGNRIPADVVELKKDQPETILFLYPAAYEIVYLNEQGERILFRDMVIR